jgi:hypothetical protein
LFAASISEFFNKAVVSSSDHAGGISFGLGIFPPEIPLLLLLPGDKVKELFGKV